MKSSAKGKSTFQLGARRVSTLTVSRKSAMDPAEFTPIVSAREGAAGKIRVLRKVDLLPKLGTSALVAPYVPFGDLLIDVISPTYGYDYPLGKPAFCFTSCRVPRVFRNGWYMNLEANQPGDQFLQVRLVAQTQGNYVVVRLGQTTDPSAPRCILKVKVDANQFYLDLSTRSYLYFDLYLLDHAAHDLEFTLSSSANNLQKAFCSISQVELYNSIRVADPIGVSG